jgi:nickel superoxide dismutase
MNIIKTILKLFPGKIAFAHCDIPCGIYDPYVIQRAAHTILRMTQLLTDLKTENPTKMAHDISRMTHVKEEHADLLEEELETLKNDYFKEEHFKTYPNLESLFTKTLKAANEVLAAVLEISEIFFKTKNVESVRVPSIYPTGGEMVLHR